jgi:hypothetical protein
VCGFMLVVIQDNSTIDIVQHMHAFFGAVRLPYKQLLLDLQHICAKITVFIKRSLKLPNKQSGLSFIQHEANFIRSSMRRKFKEDLYSLTKLIHASCVLQARRSG